MSSETHTHIGRQRKSGWYRATIAEVGTGRPRVKSPPVSIVHWLIIGPVIITRPKLSHRLLWESILNIVEDGQGKNVMFSGGCCPQRKGKSLALGTVLSDGSRVILWPTSESQ